VILDLSCDFASRGSGRLLDRRAPMLTVADPCIWHGCGTNLGRRQPATMACARLEGLMARAGQSSERAQLIYQHSTVKHQRKLGQGIDAGVRQQLREPDAKQAGTRRRNGVSDGLRSTVRPLCPLEGRW
jgi:hypothetical protein